MNKVIIVSGVALLGWYLYKMNQAKQAVSSNNVTVAKTGATSAAVYSASGDSKDLTVLPTQYASASPLYVTPINAPISDLPVPGIKKTANPKVVIPPVYTQPVKPVLISPVAPEANKLMATRQLSGLTQMILA